MKPRDLARRFLEKAAQDEALLDKVLDDGDVADEIIGFHGQQAAEKMLKAVLAAHAISFRRTHDLGELVDCVEDAGLALPNELADIDELTPFAVEARYDFLPAGGSGLDRAAMRALIARLRAWAEITVAAAPDLQVGGKGGAAPRQ